MAKRREADILCGLKYAKQIRKLSDADAGALFKDLYEFRQTGRRDFDNLGVAAEVLFDLMADDIAGNIESYDEACERNRQNAQKRWGGKTTEAEDAPASKDDNADAPHTPAQNTDVDMRPDATACDRMRPHATETDGMRSMPIEKNRKERNGTEENGDISPQPPQGTNAADAPVPEPSLPGRPHGKPILTKAQQERFDRWYAKYPHKVGKDAARKAWAKINPDDELTEIMIRAVQNQIAHDDRFREQRYIPHPATWLNRGEWENEYGDGDIPAAPPGSRNTGPYTDWTKDPDYERAMAGWPDAEGG